MTVESILTKEMATLREVGGYARMDKYGLLEIYGKDAQRFLQSQTTNDVTALPQYGSQKSCILDRKAHVIAYFTLYRKHDSYRIIADRDQISVIVEHLESYRFADKVDFVDLSAGGSFIAVQGPQALDCLSHELKLPDQLIAHQMYDQNFHGINCHLFNYSLIGGKGYLLWFSNSDIENAFTLVERDCTALEMIDLTPQLLDTARIEAGMTVFNVDFTSDSFLPETSLDEDVVSYTKGCFLGQEVLARVRSQGAPTRGLMGIAFASGQHLNLPMESKVLDGHEEIATLKSSCYSPTLDATIAIASVKREWRVPNKTMQVKIGDQDYQITILTLPFVQHGDQALARKLYEQALHDYAVESETATEKNSIVLLRKAITLDPNLQDAYEALGVILSKQDKLDEAIELMEKLAAINPDSVMAHTNLSVFYVDKGWIEKAEEEKAISMSIRMKTVAQQAAADEEAKQQRAQARIDAEERMGMFRQVLEIDADDLLANYGVGSCSVALDQFAEAIPFLTKAISLKPSYTVAYLALGQAYHGVGKTVEAVQTYEQGIAVASKRGDLSPMKEMQGKLDALRAELKKC